MPIGTLLLPNPADVRAGIQYGADGVEYTGTLLVPTGSSGSGGGRYAIDEALRLYVISIADVAAKIEARLYADDAAPQTPTFPYGTMTLIDSEGRFKKLRRPNKTHRGVRYQFDFYAYRKSHARAIAAAAASVYEDGGIDGMQGLIGSGEIGAYVQSCKIENIRHGSEAPESAGEARVYSSSFDAVLVFNEA